MNETEMTVVGNLITKVDRRRLADGTTVVSFRVASNERRYDRATSTWVNGDTLYLSVTAWRELADHVLTSMVIGDPIIVRGRLYTSSYDKEGRHHSVTEMEATAVGPNLRWSTAVVTRTPRRSELFMPCPAIANAAPDSGADGAHTSDDPWSSSAASADCDPGPGEDGFDDLGDRADAGQVACEVAVGR